MNGRNFNIGHVCRSLNELKRTSSHTSTIPGFQVFVNLSLATDFLHNQLSWFHQILTVDVELTWLLEYIFCFLLEEHTRHRSFSDETVSKISGDCKKCHNKVTSESSDFRVIICHHTLVFFRSLSLFQHENTLFSVLCLNHCVFVTIILQGGCLVTLL